jgi:hypothetical protein
MKTHHSYAIRIVALPLLLLSLTVGIATACNIPVFRYALERWKSDDYEIVVYYSGKLGAEDEAMVAKLEAASTNNGGTTNANLVQVAIDTEKDADRMEAWRVIAEKTKATLPYLTVQLKSASARTIDAWHGSMEDAKRFEIVDSPARREIAKRLLGGHSIVWIVIKSNDEKENANVIELLKEQCLALESYIKLPEGIGAPGSELYAEVPLFVKFSYIEIDSNNPDERLLIHLIQNFHSDATDAKLTFIAPVFGRGRLLEVIPSNDFNADLMRDLSMFMSGACSCQVKDRNPGIDLLMSRDWDVALFGDNGMRPPANSKTPTSKEPTNLIIPPGRKKS